MINYKRLTERSGNGIAIKDTSKNDNMSIWSAIERLAELETKIENGTLIELPCKVGQKIWYVSYIRIEEDREINILEEWDVEKIDIYDDVIICRLTHKGTDHYNTARNDEFGERWFTDKAKAEAKLEQIKKENNNER